MVVDDADVGGRGDERVRRPLEAQVAHVEVMDVGAGSGRPQRARTPRRAPRRRGSSGAGSAARPPSAGRCGGACGTSTARAPARARRRARRGARAAPSAPRASARARRGRSTGCPARSRRGRRAARAARPAPYHSARYAGTSAGRVAGASSSSARASVAASPAATAAASCGARLLAREQRVEGRDVAAHRVAAEPDRLDERRARAAERIQHEAARRAVAPDQRLGQLWRELAQVRMQAVHVLRALALRQRALGPRELEVDLGVQRFLRPGHAPTLVARADGSATLPRPRLQRDGARAPSRPTSRWPSCTRTSAGRCRPT